MQGLESGVSVWELGLFLENIVSMQYPLGETEEAGIDSETALAVRDPQNANP